MRVDNELQRLYPTIQMESYSALYGFNQSLMGEVIIISNQKSSILYGVIYPLRNVDGKIIRGYSLTRFGSIFYKADEIVGLAEVIYSDFNKTVSGPSHQFFP